METLTLNQPLPISYQEPLQATPDTSSQQSSQPQPQQSSQQASQQPNNFLTPEQMFAEFEQEKESTFNHAPEQQDSEQGSAPLENIYAPVNAPVEERPAMEEGEARKQTIRLMNMRQTAQAYAINYYADGNIKSPEQYFYKPHQFNQLVEAWLPVVQSANIKVPPFAEILMVEAACTGPLIGLTMQNRKYRKELEKVVQENQQLKAQIETVANARNDTKTAWSIDRNGYFKNGPSGAYIKDGDRSEKPKLTKENLELLVKHNGIDAVEKAYNIKL